MIKIEIQDEQIYFINGRYSCWIGNVNDHIHSQYDKNLSTNKIGATAMNAVLTTELLRRICFPEE